MSIENGNGADQPVEEISRERAKELVDEIEAGTLIALEAEPVPVLGDLDDDDDAELELLVQTYRFGNTDEYAFGDDGDDS